MKLFATWCSCKIIYYLDCLNKKKFWFVFYNMYNIAEAALLKKNDAELGKAAEDKRSTLSKIWSSINNTNRSLFIFSNENTLRKAMKAINASKYPFY